MLFCNDCAQFVLNFLRHQIHEFLNLYLQVLLCFDVLNLKFIKMEVLTMNNFREVNEDILKDWLNFREKIYVV